MIKIDDDGVTVVEIRGPKVMVMAAISITQLLKAMPEMNAIVSGIMADKIDIEEDLGVSSYTKKLDNTEDIDAALRKLRREKPAKEDDVPDFVKRAMKGESDGE